MKKLAILGSALAALSVFALPADAEPIPFRGVVEGYYGRPWGTEGRLSLLKFMGEVGMNTFIYGPKDDPYHHGRWRDEYPKDQAEDFKKLLAVAKKNKIHFYWAIHLGGAFDGSEKDYAALFKKFEAMYALGFRAFAAFFDDFGGSDAEGHATICNRILHDFLEKKGDCAPLVMCPNVYWGNGSHDYQKTLGEKLDQKINIMWTGGWICSDIRANDVEGVTKAFRRPPFIWWNWPVNDYCRSKLLLGRTYGCDDVKYAGFVSNPMENCEANKIALYGVAKWALDPANFDSVATWNESFEKLYPPKVAAAMKVFATHNSDQGPNGHGYRREESVGITDWKAEVQKIHAAVRVLKEELPRVNSNLFWEIEGWLDHQDYQAAIGRLAFKLAETKKDAERKAIVKKIIKLKTEQAAADDRHRERFAAATFGGDKGHMKSPMTALKLEETIKGIIASELNIKADPPKAFSRVAALKKPVASREGKFVRIQKIQEQTKVAPGEFFGFVAPKTVKVNYFHAKFDSSEPSKHGKIELSKDFGKTWQALETDNKGNDMQSRLKVEDGWNAARYINTSSEPVTLKLDEFKFDVDSDDEVVLMEEFVK